MFSTKLVAVSKQFDKLRKIYNECQKYLLRGDKLSKTFIRLNETDQEWVLNYLSSGKRTIPYELMPGFDSLESWLYFTWLYFTR